jgi:hypothetical protein
MPAAWCPDSRNPPGAVWLQRATPWPARYKLPAVAYMMQRSLAATVLAWTACAALLHAMPARADAIYKCADSAGSVTYQNAPCKGGAKLDLAPGKYDPAAMEQLQTERKEFEARDAQRRADARAADAQRAAAQAAADARAQVAASAQTSATDCPDCNWSYVLPYPIDAWRPHPPRPRPPPVPPVPVPGTLPGVAPTRPGPPLIHPAPPGVPRAGTAAAS